MAIVGYKVKITCEAVVVYETETAWPEDDNPNIHLNDVIEAWEAEQATPARGIYVVTYEKL